MEDIATLWTFQESIDEVKQKVEYMRYEVELTKKKANEERMKNDEQINKLLELLQAACKERDEAKAQLEKLQQHLMVPINNHNNKPSFDHIIPLSPDTPLFANSSLAESQSQSQSQSYVSSPAVDSLSYPPPPPPSSSRDSTNDMNGFNPKVEMIEPTIRGIDQEGSLVIENLAKGRPLPEKGKFLEAVIEAGPLLQTLLVAGPLPQWRNPPVSLLPGQIPPVAIKGCGIRSSGMDVPHDWNFGTSCLMGGRYFNTASAVNFDSQFSKRQRIQ